MANEEMVWCSSDISSGFFRATYKLEQQPTTMHFSICEKVLFCAMWEECLCDKVVRRQYSLAQVAISIMNHPHSIDSALPTKQKNHQCLCLKTGWARGTNSRKDFAFKHERRVT